MDTKGRKLFQYAACILAAVVLTTTAYSTTAMASEIGVIHTADLLEIHAESNDSSAVLGQVMDDGHVAILERDGSWVKIHAGEIIGWIPAMNLLETDISVEEAVEANQEMIAELAEEATGAEEAEEESEEAAAESTEEVQEVEVQESGKETVEEETKATAAAYAEAVPVETEYAAEAAVQAAVAEVTVEETVTETKAVRTEAGISEEELYLLANIIYCEAGGEPYIGKVAVGNVILNRVKSSSQPNTIKEVVYAKGQFSPVKNGNLARALRKGSADESCYQAAQEALGGATPVGDKMFFRRVNGRAGQVIGHHVFW